MSGLTYEMVKHWPRDVVYMVYDIIVHMWADKEVPPSWKWKWLVPLPKKDNPTAAEIRPIMLIEVLRKIWTGLIMKTIHSTLLKHKVLHPSQHGFQPGHGTETANVQVINMFEEAKANRRNLYGSS